MDQKKSFFNDKIRPYTRNLARYVYNTWIFKCLAIAFCMEFVLEILGRRSFVQAFFFLIKSPFVYFYNVSIIFFTLLFALFIRRRVFGLIIISVIWLVCGIVNFVVLGYRVTPFAAIDILMLEDVMSMIDVYFKQWQLMLILLGICIVAVGLVVLFFKTPKFIGSRKVKTTMVACVLAWVIISLMTSFSVKHNIISDDFANLGMAYKDYGFAYCFTNSIIDNGISKPDDYSEDTMLEIKNKLDAFYNDYDTRKPNVIVIQLESFFDPNDVVGLTLSSNPIPNFTALKEQYPSGFFTVPALGAGTANTEFEVLTGLESNFFGAGEYPYKTTVNKTPVESLCSIFKREGYTTYSMHNNKGSFYDRFDVYDTMGFDYFIPLEYMYNVEYTSTGWAKDSVLIDNIIKCIKNSENPSFVYTISVQGHGRYPDEYDSCEDHIQLSYDVEDMENKFHYYVNQIYEMDQMIGELVDELDALGDDYVLVLYGDHLPTLDLTEEQLPNSSLFQTEYIIVNNIGLDIDDEAIHSYELSTRLLSALDMEPGYAQKIQTYYEDVDVREEKLLLLAYDMLFGKRYMYGGRTVVEESDMQYGIDRISITKVKNVDSHIVVSGENFNPFSVVYIDGEPMETTFVDINTLLVEDKTASRNDSFTVKQVDESHHVRGTTDEFVYK